MSVLGLNHPDVLGWSMGSMITQALTFGGVASSCC
jgi:hypothetical protein